MTLYVAPFYNGKYYIMVKQWSKKKEKTPVKYLLTPITLYIVVKERDFSGKRKENTCKIPFDTNNIK